MSVPGCRTRSPGPLLMSVETLPKRPAGGQAGIPRDSPLPPARRRRRPASAGRSYMAVAARRRRRRGRRRPERPSAAGATASASDGSGTASASAAGHADGRGRQARCRRPGAAAHADTGGAHRAAARRSTSVGPLREHAHDRRARDPGARAVGGRLHDPRLRWRRRTFGRSTWSSQRPRRRVGRSHGDRRRRPGAPRRAWRTGPACSPQVDRPEADAAPLVTSGATVRRRLAHVVDEAVVVLAEARRPRSARSADRRADAGGRPSARRRAAAEVARPSRRRLGGARPRGPARRRGPRAANGEPVRRPQLDEPGPLAPAPAARRPRPGRRRWTAAARAPPARPPRRGRRPTSRNRRGGVDVRRHGRAEARPQRGPAVGARRARSRAASWPWNGGLPTTSVEAVPRRRRPALRPGEQRVGRPRGAPARARCRRTTARAPPPPRPTASGSMSAPQSRSPTTTSPGHAAADEAAAAASSSAPPPQAGSTTVATPPTRRARAAATSVGQRGAACSARPGGARRSVSDRLQRGHQRPAGSAAAIGATPPAGRRRGATARGRPAGRRPRRRPVPRPPRPAERPARATGDRTRPGRPRRAARSTHGSGDGRHYGSAGARRRPARHPGAARRRRGRRRLEADGYDGTYTFEGPHDPFLPLVLAAEATERLELMTAVAIAFARSPMTLAAQAWDLQRCPRAASTSASAARSSRTSSAASRCRGRAPAARMRELVLAIRAIWASWQDRMPLRFEGEHYTHTLMTPFFDPGPDPIGTPPIWLGGVGPADDRGGRRGGRRASSSTRSARSARSSRSRCPPLERGRAAPARRPSTACRSSLPVMVATGADRRRASTRPLERGAGADRVLRARPPPTGSSSTSTAGATCSRSSRT